MDNISVFLSSRRGISVVQKLISRRYPVKYLFCPSGKRENIAQNLKNIPDTTELVAVNDVNETSFVEWLAGKSPDLFVVAGFPTIFKPRLIGLPAVGTLNLHGGKLPKYRGGSPLNWQIISGEAFAGLSVILMDDGIDTGRIVASAEIEIGRTSTIADIHDKADRIFPELTIEAVEKLEAGFAGIDQDEEAACYWHQRADADGGIDWQGKTAHQVYNFVRGITRPYPGAFSYCEGKEIRIYGAEKTKLKISGRPGRVLYLQNQGPFVICQDRAVILTDIEFPAEPVSYKIPHGVCLSSEASVTSS
jgi:methionyl-tRNA formyltransferase